MRKNQDEYGKVDNAKAVDGRFMPLKLTSMFAMLVIALSLLVVQVQASPAAPPAYDAPDCEIALPGARIGRAAPATADLDGDGRQEIVVAGTDGIVYALTFTDNCSGGNGGSLLWATQVANLVNGRPGLLSSPQRIEASPAIADLDGDGNMEIVVATGWMPEYHLNGAIIVLDHNGNLVPGWPRTSRDLNGAGNPPWDPDGYADGFFSTPALGDIDNDGLPEIVVGGFDKCIYVLEGDNNPVAGWWDYSANHPKYCLIDTIWASPAIADLNGDGRQDVVIGTDAHPDYNGGSVWAISGDSTLMWVYDTTQIVQSSAAVEDINGDGLPEVIFGTGTYYPGNGGHKVYALDRNGNTLPGWPVPTQGNMPSSPAIADLDGNGTKEIIIGCGAEPDVGNTNACSQRQLYVLQHNGSHFPYYPTAVAAGIPWTPQPPSAVAIGPVVGDIDADGKDNILVVGAGAWGVTSFNYDLPEYQKVYSPSGAGGDSLSAPPALTNLTSNGNLVMITAGTMNGQGRVWLWRFGQQVAEAMPWPQFRHNSARTGRATVPAALEVSHDQIGLLHPIGGGHSVEVDIVLQNPGGGSLDYTASHTGGSGVTLISPSGTLDDQAVITVRVNTNRAPGTYDLGTVTIVASQGGVPVPGSPQSVPVSLYIGEISYNYLPAVTE